MINHPNAGGVFVLGLGCENNQIDHLKKFIGDFDESRVRFLASQDVEDEVETGLEILKEIYEVMHTDKRETVPLSELNIGLKCGGSDGFFRNYCQPVGGGFLRFSGWRRVEQLFLLKYLKCLVPKPC